MEITKEMVSYVAELSRLKLSEEEIEAARQDLGRITDYVDVLKKVDTDGIEPISHAFAVKNVLREDVVKPSMPREEILKVAPKSDEEAIIVPKTVE